VPTSSEDHKKTPAAKEKPVDGARKEAEEKGILGNFSFDLNGYAQKTSNTITELFGKCRIFLASLFAHVVAYLSLINQPIYNRHSGLGGCGTLINWQLSLNVT
jgi:hypothetical protein